MVGRAGGDRRLLVTGGAGFIGRNLIAHLGAGGCWGAITVLDDESTGDRAALARLGVRFIAGDLRDRDALDAAVPGHDAVVHLAAMGGVVASVAAPERAFAVNAEGSLRLLEACRRHGVRRVIAASSGGALLGEGACPAHEELPARPVSPYGASKLAMEGCLSAYAGAYGLSTLALRFSNVYGPGSAHKEGAVARFCQALATDRPVIVHGDGTQTRDFLYVGDLVVGIAAALESPTTGVLQLGSGCPTSVNALLAILAEVAGRGHPRVRYRPARPGEVHASWCDISRARAAIGFDAPTPPREGLARTWAWFSRRAAGVEEVG